MIRVTPVRAGETNINCIQVTTHLNKTKYGGRSFGKFVVILPLRRSGHKACCARRPFASEKVYRRLAE